MNETVILELLVNRGVADKVSADGLAEIALRRADAKFSAMVKCKILGEGISSDSAYSRIASSAMQATIPTGEGTGHIQSSLRVFEQRLGQQAHIISPSVKKMAMQVDGLFDTANAIRRVAHINAGLSMTNLAVDIAGFIIINNKLNILSSEIKKINSGIDAVRKIKENEKIRECQSLILRYKSVSAEIQRDGLIDLKEIERLLIDMKTFESEMLRNLCDGSLEKPLVLDIIYTLLPAYAVLLNSFMRLHFLKKGILPALHEDFEQLFDEFLDPSINKTIVDYYILEEKEHFRYVSDVIDADTLFALNARTLVEDQTTLLKQINSKEQLKAFDDIVGEIIHRRVSERIPEVAELSGFPEEQCEEFLKDCFTK